MGSRQVISFIGQYKDILSPFRDLAAGEQAILQGIVTESYQQFLNAIVAGRKISLEQLKPLADGRIFTGAQAQQVKLVDSLGNTHDALMKAAELAKISGEPTVRNYSSPGWRDSLGIFFSSVTNRFIPNIRELQMARWQKIPLTLWE